MAASADPVLTSHPIDLLYARGVLSEHEALAAFEYEKIRSRVYGLRSSCRSTLSDLFPRRHTHYRTEVEQLAYELQSEADFEGALSTLRDVGAQAAIDDLIVFRRLDADISTVKRGLAELGRFFGEIYGRRRRLEKVA